ncbi:MAG: ABC transporter substrate-binding protein [Terriglobales bacterium]
MRHAFLVALVLLLEAGAWAQTSNGCACGSHPPGRPEPRSSKPYAGTPEDLRPYSKFTTPYYEHYTDLVEYNGAARDVPEPTDITEVRIGFLGPIENHPDQVFGRRMLNGATLAIDEANAAGGYCGKPFRLMLHNDSAIWGAASNEIVKMVYDDKVWAMFGSISSDTTHIALRMSLKAELPIVNSASTDPTIPETIIPWYFTDIQDDRVQGYTLARHVYTELGLKRIALLRVNNRYGRFGVIKFRDASRRLGHPVVIEQKFQPGDTDFGRQLRVIQESGVDGIVLWTDIGPAAMILKQMQELGMKQRVFGSYRTIGDELIRMAGTAAEGFEAVYPYDPSRHDRKWADFNQHFEARFHEKPDHFAALAYDAMQVLLDAICRAGLNKGRIRDALTGVTSYKGVTGDMMFDPNCKNVSPMFLASVHHGTIEYRRITMEKPYARVGEDGVQYAGPQLPDEETLHKEGKDWRIAVFGPQADQIMHSPEITHLLGTLSAAGRHFSLIGISSEGRWGKASTELVQAVYQDRVLGIIATDRNASHLAEQIGTKAFVPVIAISSDRMLTSANIPWIFRLPQGTPLEQALRCLADAANRTGPNRGKIRAVLASGTPVAGVRFQSTGELK